MTAAGLDRNGFIGRLGGVVVAAVLVYLLLWQNASPQTFNLYGWAGVVLAFLVPLTFVLLARLRAQGRARAWAALVIVPLLILAGGQIAYWLAFFGSPERAIGLGVGREMIGMKAGGILDLVGLTVFAAWGWLLASLLRSDTRAPPG